MINKFCKDDQQIHNNDDRISVGSDVLFRFLVTMVALLTFNIPPVKDKSAKKFPRCLFIKYISYNKR